MPEYMYLIARSDVPSAIAQIAHAAMVAGLAYQRTDTNVIVLQVTGKLKLLDACMRLEQKRLSFVSFREPDLNDELTAVCSAPTTDAKLFRNLQLFSSVA